MAPSKGAQYVHLLECKPVHDRLHIIQVRIRALARPTALR